MAPDTREIFSCRPFKQAFLTSGWQIASNWIVARKHFLFLKINGSKNSFHSSKLFFMFELSQRIKTIFFKIIFGKTKVKIFSARILGCKVERMRRR